MCDSVFCHYRCLLFSQHLGVDKGEKPKRSLQFYQLIAVSILAQLPMVIIPGTGQTNLFIFYFLSTYFTKWSESFSSFFSNLIKITKKQPISMQKKILLCKPTMLFHLHLKGANYKASVEKSDFSPNAHVIGKKVNRTADRLLRWCRINFSKKWTFSEKWTYLLNHKI